LLFPAKAGTNGMLSFKARVTGRLAAEANGWPIVVPRGHCDVRSHAGVVSLSWAGGDGVARSIVLAAPRFEEHLEAGAVVIADPVELCRPRVQRVTWSAAGFTEMA